MVWGSFLIAAAARKTPTRNGYHAQGVNLTLYDLGNRWGQGVGCPGTELDGNGRRGQRWPLHDIAITNIVWCMAFTGEVGEDRILRNGRVVALQ